MPSLPPNFETMWARFVFDHVVCRYAVNKRAEENKGNLIAVDGCLAAMNSTSGRELYREGFLQKAGRRSFQAWRKRWFVLNGTVLKYYPTQDTSESNLLGTIDMSQVQSIVVSRTVKNGFELAMKGRTYCVSGKSEEERSDWISVLRRASHIGQEVERQRGINGGELSRASGVDGSGDSKQTMLPSSLYDTLRDAENAKKGRSTSKVSTASVSSSGPTQTKPSSGSLASDDDAVYEVPKTPSKTSYNSQDMDCQHYKMPIQQSADNPEYDGGMSSSEDDLDAEDGEAGARRFAQRHRSMDSVATIDSADFTEVDSEDEYSDEVDGEVTSVISEDEFLPLPRSDNGMYAVDELKSLARGTPDRSVQEINTILAERNCRYSGSDYPAFEALKMVLKIN